MRNFIVYSSVQLYLNSSLKTRWRQMSKQTAYWRQGEGRGKNKQLTEDKARAEVKINSLLKTRRGQSSKQSNLINPLNFTIVKTYRAWNIIIYISVITLYTCFAERKVYVKTIDTSKCLQPLNDSLYRWTTSIEPISTLIVSALNWVKQLSSLVKDRV